MLLTIFIRCRKGHSQEDHWRGLLADTESSLDHPVMMQFMIIGVMIKEVTTDLENSMIGSVETNSMMTVRKGCYHHFRSWKRAKERANTRPHPQDLKQWAKGQVILRRNRLDQNQKQNRFHHLAKKPEVLPKLLISFVLMNLSSVMAGIRSPRMCPWS